MSDQYPPQQPQEYPPQYQPPQNLPQQAPYPNGSYPPPPPPPPGYQPPAYGSMPPGAAYPAGPGYAPVGAVPVAGNSKLAIASLICGIVGLCTGLPAIPAVICGHLALSEIKKSNNYLQGRGMAIAGLVLGYLEIVGIVLYIIIIVIIAAASAGNVPAQ